jgi:hypothetical protein
MNIHEQFIIIIIIIIMYIIIEKNKYKHSNKDI